MKLQELKTWIEGLPEEFMNYEVVHAEVIRTDEDESDEDNFTVRLDKPITALTVDQESKEILIMNDYEGNLDDLEFDIDPHDAKEMGNKIF
jgi:hypothetical protein